MTVRKNGRKRNPSNDLAEKLILFGTIPLVIILLIVIILKMDHAKTNEESSSELPVASLAGGVTQDPDITEENNSSSQTGQDEDITDNTDGSEDENGENETLKSDTETSEPTPDMSDPDPAQYPFQQDAVLELTGLVQSYCEAKKECDPDLLAWVFDMKDWSEEQKNEEHSRMELVKASIKSYENISCYSIQGPEEDSYVIFPYYEIRYREIETLMPTFSWGYAKKNEEGRYYMVQETTDAVNDYIRKAGEKPEVKAVMSQILSRQQEAIASDEALQKIYGRFSESEVIIGGTAR